VAVDLDETIINSRNETLIPGALDALLSLKKDGWKIVIWTARADSQTHVPEILKRLGIPYDTINEDVDGVTDRSRKIFFDAVVDDKNVNLKDGWDSVLEDLAKRREGLRNDGVTKSAEKVSIIRMSPVTGDTHTQCVFGLDKSGKAVLLEGGLGSIEKEMIGNISPDSGAEFLKAIMENVNTSFFWAE
jgi:nitrogen fixation protein